MPPDRSSEVLPLEVRHQDPISPLAEVDPTKFPETPTIATSSRVPNAPQTRRNKRLSNETLWPTSLSSLRDRGLVDDTSRMYNLPVAPLMRKSSHSRSSSTSSAPVPSLSTSSAPPPLSSQTVASEPTPQTTASSSSPTMAQEMLNAELTNLVNLLSQYLQQNLNLAATLQGNARPPAPTQAAEGRWRLEEVGIFEPDLPVDDHHPARDAVTVGRDTIYRNVNAFCERIADAISSKGAVMVRDNLQSCLRGQALRWYTHELATTDKTFLRTDISPNLDQWIVRLHDRFR